jgi:hypothetical protein
MTRAEPMHDQVKRTVAIQGHAHHVVIHEREREYDCDISCMLWSDALLSSLRVFSSNPKNLSHRMFRHMHGVLNVDEKKLIA